MDKGRSLLSPSHPTAHYDVHPHTAFVRPRPAIHTTTCTYAFPFLSKFVSIHIPTHAPHMHPAPYTTTPGHSYLVRLTSSPTRRRPPSLFSSFTLVAAPCSCLVSMWGVEGVESVGESVDRSIPPTGVLECSVSPYPLLALGRILPLLALLVVVQLDRLHLALCAGHTYGISRPQPITSNGSVCLSVCLVSPLNPSSITTQTKPNKPKRHTHRRTPGLELIRGRAQQEQLREDAVASQTFVLGGVGYGGVGE